MAGDVGRGREGDYPEIQLHDLELLDQEGDRVRFVSDVIRDRVAVVIPFYTACPTTYPVLVYLLGRVQDLLGEGRGKEVVLVSVTVDPARDLPPRLREYARRHRAKPGWVFLTGSREDLTRVLRGTGLLASRRLEDHNHIPRMIVGSVGGPWRRFHGFPSPRQILEEVDRASRNRHPSGEIPPGVGSIAGNGPKP